MNPASRLVVAAELIHRLAVATPPTSAGLASSALEQLLRAAPLPENPGLPLSDASPCVAALLTLALRDVSIAHGDGPTVDGSSGNWPPSTRRLPACAMLALARAHAVCGDGLLELAPI
jgi:hypothetical protein